MSSKLMTQNITKTREHQDATDIKEKPIFCFSDFSNFIYDFLNAPEKCWDTALVRQWLSLGVETSFKL